MLAMWALGALGWAGAEGGDDMESMWKSGKWSCNGLDVRRSMRLESMRYQLDREGAAGPMCIFARFRVVVTC